MVFKKVLCLFGLLAGILLCPAGSSALVVIDEFLADPPLGSAGDANGDGIRNSSDDEFVELLNTGGADQDLSLWSLWDSTALRHLFAQGTQLAPSERLVVFGGGQPAGIPGQVFTASSGLLSLNNSGDEILLKDSSGQVADHVIFSSEADKDQSLTRFPEGSGSFVLHRSVSSQGLSFSPGTGPGGTGSVSGTVAPEPASFLLIGLGLLASTTGRLFGSGKE